MSGNLTHRPQKVVQQLLSDLSLGTLLAADDDWPIFVDGYADGDDIDDNLLCVYGTQGSQQGRKQTDGGHIEYHGIQVIVRATDENVGYAKAKAIAQAMDATVKRNSVTIDTSTYLVHNMDRTSDVLPFTREVDEDLRRFSMNFLLSVTQTA